MRNFVLAVVCLVDFLAAHSVPQINPRRSIHTEARIENQTPLDVINTETWDVDGYDWDGSGTPTNGFNSVQIKAGDALQARLEVNYYASNCPWGITIYFEDGTQDQFKINEKYAVGKADPNFIHSSNLYDISYERDGDLTLVLTIRFTGIKQLDYDGKVLANQAKELLEEGNYEEAEKAIDAAVSKAQFDDTTTLVEGVKFDVYKEYGRVLYERGIKDIANGDVVEAASDFTLAKYQLVTAEEIRTDEEIERELEAINSFLS